ncbi:hypothetical protein ACOMHN_015155 [Nucella lapillus]
MKSMQVLLLLCLVIVVKGGDPCTRGEDAIEHFMDMRSCDGLKPRTLGERLLDSIRGNTTVDNVDYVDSVQNCSADQRDYLTTTLDYLTTSLACEPNTANVHPYFKHLLTYFTDADLVRSEACPSMGSQQEVFSCIDEGIAATGMTMGEFMDLLTNGTLQEVIPLVPIVLNTALECLVGKFREARCDHWRGEALRLIMTRTLFPSVLGRYMTLSQQQLVDMFELFTDADEGKRQTLSNHNAGHNA